MPGNLTSWTQATSLAFDESRLYSSSLLYNFLTSHLASTASWPKHNRFIMPSSLAWSWLTCFVFQLNMLRRSALMSKVSHARSFFLSDCKMDSSDDGISVIKSHSCDDCLCCYNTLNWQYSLNLSESQISCFCHQIEHHCEFLFSPSIRLLAAQKRWLMAPCDVILRTSWLRHTWQPTRLLQA